MRYAPRLRVAWAAVLFALLGRAWPPARSAEREVFVAPAGTPAGKGTKESPLDLKSAFGYGHLLKPGTTVWVAGGRYEIGQLRQGREVQGTKDQPIVFRAVPGERATIAGGFSVTQSHTWLWGLEIAGPNECGVGVAGGDGVKLINLVIHDAGPAEPPKERKPSGQGIGPGDVGNDHEYYGNLVYQNGWNGLDHGIYPQNTARHTPKRIVDNVFFENAGFGIHAYGEAPTLCGFHVEGNICFATAKKPRAAQEGGVNILLGGQKPISNIVLKDNCTYHPDAGSKRGVDIGFHGHGNSNILVEHNYFMCGSNAIELKNVLDAVVRDNTFWAPSGMISVTYGPGADKSKVIFEGNTYIDNKRFDLAQWRATTGSAKTDKVVRGKDGRPTGLLVFKRVNQYEPERVHLAVYNWDRRPVVRIALKDILQAGDSYRVVSVLDYFGKPVAQGKAPGACVDLPMKGRRYEPEFGAYILFRPRPSVPPAPQP